MDNSINTIRKDEKGFTLVELAVVMIIIGLLIGGILKGQELITNARVTSSIGQMEGISAAYNDFRNQYNSVPGDMAAGVAAARIAQCGVTCAQTGNNNGTLTANIGGAIAAGEGTAFFGQLLAAGYITGMTGATTNGGFGDSNPSAAAGGGYTAGSTTVGVTGFTAANFRTGAYIVLTGGPAVVANGTGILTGQQAANIDRRLDDGMGNTGSVLGDSGALCQVVATGVYNQAAANSSCTIAYRL